eukprot:107975_1
MATEASHRHSMSSKRATTRRPVESLFKHNDLFKLDFEIPKNGTKEVIQKLRDDVNNLYDEDIVALETFYDDQLRILDERLLHWRSFPSPKKGYQIIPKKQHKIPSKTLPPPIKQYVPSKGTSAEDPEAIFDIIQPLGEGA